MGRSARLLVGCMLAAVFAMTGCEQQETRQVEPAPAEEAPAETRPVGEQAVANLSPTEGNTVSGVVRFTRMDEGIRIEATVSGLPEGAHGFHVHENGDCSHPESMSAGGHFDPHGMPHGAPDAPQRHVGDLGNIMSDGGDVAHYTRVDTVLSFEGANNILNRAVIVHASPDDLTTQPTGDAGARLACGVIERIENGTPATGQQALQY